MAPPASARTRCLSRRLSRDGLGSKIARLASLSRPAGRPGAGLCCVALAGRAPRRSPGSASAIPRACRVGRHEHAARRRPRSLHFAGRMSHHAVGIPVPVRVLARSIGEPGRPDPKSDSIPTLQWRMDLSARLRTTGRFGSGGRFRAGHVRPAGDDPAALCTNHRRHQRAGSGRKSAAVHGTIPRAARRANLGMPDV
jgi:hypothetical protein